MAIPKSEIAVDFEFLAKLFQLKEWPKSFEPKDDLDSYALRVITDANRADKDIVGNARYWVKRAFEDGKKAGIETERARWQANVRKMFGLEEK